MAAAVGGREGWLVPAPQRVSLFRFLSRWEDLSADQVPPGDPDSPLRRTMFPPPPPLPATATPFPPPGQAADISSAVSGVNSKQHRSAAPAPAAPAKAEESASRAGWQAVDDKPFDPATLRHCARLLPHRDAAAGGHFYALLSRSITASHSCAATAAVATEGREDVHQPPSAAVGPHAAAVRAPASRRSRLFESVFPAVPSASAARSERAAGRGKGCAGHGGEAGVPETQCSAAATVAPAETAVAAWMEIAEFYGLSCGSNGYLLPIVGAAAATAGAGLVPVAELCAASTAGDAEDDLDDATAGGGVGGWGGPRRIRLMTPAAAELVLRCDPPLHVLGLEVVSAGAAAFELVSANLVSLRACPCRWRPCQESARLLAGLATRRRVTVHACTLRRLLAAPARTLAIQPTPAHAAAADATSPAAQDEPALVAALPGGLLVGVVMSGSVTGGGCGGGGELWVAAVRMGREVQALVDRERASGLLLALRIMTGEALMGGSGGVCA